MSRFDSHRRRVLASLSRNRALVASLAWAGVASSGALVSACTLRCQEGVVVTRTPVMVEREPDESEDAWMARCVAVCRSASGSANSNCVRVDDEGVACENVEPRGCYAGREPLGQRAYDVGSDASDHESGLRRLIADELSSVVAFEELAGLLPRFGAPSAFARAAWRFADDERRHATSLFALASSERPVAARVRRAPPASLVEAALHNARAGCVEETFAAHVASHQARNAASPALRAVCASIARDEVAHARFAWALDRWFRGRLAAEHLRALDQAHARAVRELRQTLTRPLGVASLGFPAPHVAADLCDTLFRFSETACDA